MKIAGSLKIHLIILLALFMVVALEAGNGVFASEYDVRIINTDRTKIIDGLSFDPKEINVEELEIDNEKIISIDLNGKYKNQANRIFWKIKGETKFRNVKISLFTGEFKISFASLGDITPIQFVALRPDGKKEEQLCEVKIKKVFIGAPDEFGFVATLFFPAEKNIISELEFTKEPLEPVEKTIGTKKKIGVIINGKFNGQGKRLFFKESIKSSYKTVRLNQDGKFAEFVPINKRETYVFFGVAGMCGGSEKMALGIKF